MKENRFNHLLAEGKVPIGHMLFEFGTRNIAKILEETGIDFVCIDTEHAGFSSSEIADLMAWFRATQVTPFVRVPQIQYHFAARALDAGALGIVVPNVKNADDVRAVVEAAKYAPEGKRGLILGDAHTDFKAVHPREFMDYSNRNTTILCQIESQEGLENLDEIAAMPGINVLWLGQFDLTQALGIPGDFNHPRFIDALKHTVETAKKNNLSVCMQPDNMTQAQEWLGFGVNIISYSGDFYVYLEAVRDGVGKLRHLTTPEAAPKNRTAV